MKLVIQPYTYGEKIKRKLLAHGSSTADVAPIIILSQLFMLRYFGYLAESVDLFLSAFSAVYGCYVIKALYWGVGQAIRTPLAGVPKSDILKWMEGSNLDTAFEHHTLHVTTITEDVPYFNVANILGAIVTAITMPAFLLRITLYEGMCNLYELKVVVVKPSTFAANFSFGHELGHIVQALQFYEHPPLLATAEDFQYLPKMSYHGSPDKQVVCTSLEKVLYMEWEADLHALYFGVTALKLDTQAMAAQLTDNRNTVKNYNFRYHLSMAYLPVLLNSIRSLQEAEILPTWEEFIESAYQQIPSSELAQWRELVATYLTGDTIDDIIDVQGQAIFKEKLLSRQ